MLLTLLLSSGTALGYGISDFIGGNASRSERPVRVAAFSHIAGLAGMLVAALLWGASSVSPNDLLWGAAAGVSGGIGIFSLYAALRAGRMGVVAPITAAIGASLPVLYGTLIGERLAAMSVSGLAVVFVAILLVSIPRAEGHEPLSRVALGFSILAGVFFSGSFILLSNTGAASGLWPAVILRVVSVGVLGTGALITTRGLVPARPVLLATIAAGLVETVATVFMLLAVQSGPIAVAAVVGSLYPAVTALLARVTIKEHLARHQIVGLGVALIGIALLSV
ncbi:MAG: DMT family transporter [Actinobacteria bacterium]|nr:MAG: DMT family transporter [Actinomycetota bacterium]